MDASHLTNCYQELLSLTCRMTFLCNERVPLNILMRSRLYWKMYRGLCQRVLPLKSGRKIRVHAHPPPVLQLTSFRDRPLLGVMAAANGYRCSHFQRQIHTACMYIMPEFLV